MVCHGQGAMLIGIGISSCISWLSGLHPLPTTLVEFPRAQWMWPQFDWVQLIARWQETGPIMLAFLFVCVFDTAGVQFGAGMQADLLVDGKLPGARAAFLGASFATTLGALLGTSPTIIHNETCAGIADGGRTGLTALVVAGYFTLSIFFVPIFAAVPTTATAPALVIVGCFMTGPAGAMDWDNFKESLPAYLTIAVMPLTYSIANGVAAGLVSYAALAAFSATATAVHTLIHTRTGRVGRTPLSEPLTGAEREIRLNGSHGSSASLSPHAMVREPLRVSERKASFNGLSASPAAPSLMSR